jgi:hypothetical protein
MIWNGNELCVHGEGQQRRVKGARREDTPSDYDDVERDAFSMIDDVVDEQAYVANATGEMLVFLALGDGENWNQAKTSSDCTIWDTLASRTFAWGQNRIHHYHEASYNPKMPKLRGSEIYHCGSHPENDNWHFLPGIDNYSYAIEFARHIIHATKVCYELCCPSFDNVERPQGAGPSTAPPPPPPPMAPPPRANAPMPRPPGVEVPMISDVISTQGRFAKCQVGQIFPFGDVGAPQYLPPDSVNVNSKEFISWLEERHDDRPA